ncbi:MAG: hypothetical protein ACOC56_06170 [Atribacterota bacterium]
MPAYNFRNKSRSCADKQLSQLEDIDQDFICNRYYQKIKLKEARKANAD